jgi:GNAT superfamily N-acetyltransferase
MEHEGQIIGSGGINFPVQNSATISWDIVHPDFHGMGLGSRLLNYRIEQLKEIKDVQNIKVRTSQFVYEFYEKNGFKLLNKVDDYWAKGFHLYEMELSH